jgi:hypothetical protein
VLAPWSVRELHFDETLGQFDGYDFDFCLQVRAAGRKVRTADLKVVHHHSLELLSNPERWIEANLRVIEKWEGRFPQVGGVIGADPTDWKRRARRAESEAAAARTMRIAAAMQANARERELLGELESIRGSLSWRLTAPLRRGAAWLRSRSSTRR